MPRRVINVGLVGGDKTGENLRQGGIDINANFAELYGFAAAIPVLVPYSLAPVFDATGGGSAFFILLTGDVSSSTLIGLQPGQPVAFIIKQDNFGGHEFVWPPNVKGAMIVSGLPGSVSSQAFRADMFASPPNVYPVTPGVTGVA